MVNASLSNRLNVMFRFTEFEMVFPDLGFCVRMLCIRTQKPRSASEARESCIGTSKPCTGDKSARAGRGLHAEDEAIRMQTTTLDKPLACKFQPVLEAH